MKEMDSKDFLMVNVCEQNSDSRHTRLVLPDINETCRHASQAEAESVFLIIFVV